MAKATKYIFVTGGVLSGLGKGITAASIANLLKARGYRVNLQPVGEHMASDIAPDEIDFARIGSSVRLAKVLTQLDATAWPAIARYLADKFPEHLDYLPPEGKLKLGLSVFGVPATTQQLFRTGLELKKICKQAGRSVRLVPNTESALSSAQVLHNQLTSELGWELLLVRDGNKTWLAQTVAVQDITAYARRDQNRPKRDARVGMLPPKLAQTIVNLATADTNPQSGAVVLDPFCGTGVILQEAALMGFDIYGTDVEPRMIEYSDQNLTWLQDHLAGHITVHNQDKRYYRLEPGDATEHSWAPPPSIVASETYLGRPLSNWPGNDTLREIIGTWNVIIEKFLRNIHSQISPGTRLCLAVPA